MDYYDNMNLDVFCDVMGSPKFVKIAPYTPEEENDDVVRNQRKRPLNSLKTPLTASEAKNWASRGGRLGWIVPKRMIVIDVDNKDHPETAKYISEILLMHDVRHAVNYSKNGAHFIFSNVSEVMNNKSQFASKINHLGMVTDGRGDNKGYIILPVNDKNRDWGEWQIGSSKSGKLILGIDDLPFYLRPVRQSTTNDVSFIGMGKGGRNDAVFRLLTAINRANLVDKSQSDECVKIISENLLAEPLDEIDLSEDGLCRDLSEYNNGNHLTADGTDHSDNGWKLVAMKLIETQDLITINELVHKKENGVYVPLDSTSLQQLVHIHGDNNASKTQRNEIIEFIKVLKVVKPKETNLDSEGIPCANGYVDLYNLELIEPRDKYSTIRVKPSFNPEVEYSARIDEFMKFVSSGDPDVMKLLYEIAGYSLMRKNKFHKFFIIVGGGGTGKSTYTSIVRKMFHSINCTSISLGQFEQDYYLGTLGDSMLNIDDDGSSDRLLKDAGRFKSIVAGEPMTARPIYSEPFQMECMSTIIVSANSIPKIQDTTDGLFRRMIIVELNNKVKTPDRDFLAKITQSDMDYFFYKACEAISGVLSRGGKFTPVKSSVNATSRFKAGQNSFTCWANYKHIRTGFFKNKSAQTLYGDYKLWCENSGYKPFSLLNFIEKASEVYRLNFIYDETMQDRVAGSADTADDYTPFNSTLSASYF